MLIIYEAIRRTAERVILKELLSRLLNKYRIKWNHYCWRTLFFYAANSSYETLDKSWHSCYISANRVISSRFPDICISDFSSSDKNW